MMPWQMDKPTPMPMVLEEWPGGRWFRDLGNGQGHLWGFVQVIKPPTLIEIQGPLFMSYAVAGHVQMRLTQISDRTTLVLSARAPRLDHARTGNPLEARVRMAAADRPHEPGAPG